MRPNVEFRVDLPKTNPDLAKSHLQRKTHGYAQKTTPDIVSLKEFEIHFGLFFEWFGMGHLNVNPIQVYQTFEMSSVCVY